MRDYVFGLLRPNTPALQCLGAISGAGGLARLIDFSCMCAGRVPVAPVGGCRDALSVPGGLMAQGAA